MLPGQIDLDANVRIWNGPDRSQLGDRSSVGPAPPKAACPRHNHPCTRDGDREFTSQNLLLDTPMPGQSTGAAVPSARRTGRQRPHCLV